MTIYERIKFLREKLQMSQQELALRVGYKDKSAVSKVERGERDINQLMLARYAVALNTTPAYLMGWAEEEKTPPNEMSEGKRKLIEFAESVPEDKIDLVLRVMQSIVEAD